MKPGRARADQQLAAVRADAERLASAGPGALLLEAELTTEVPGIPGQDAHGRPVTQAWVLCRDRGRPIGLVQVDVPPGGLTPAEVPAAIRAATGEAVVPGPPVGDAGEGGTTPSITVVVCTRERPEELRRALSSLVAQTTAAFDVLVVDNAPRTEATREVVEELRDQLAVRHVVEPRPGLSRARNTALRSVTSDVIAWLDDDEEADPAWVAETRRAFQAHPGAGAVSGVVVPAELRTRAQVWFEQFGGHSKGRGFVPQVLDPAAPGAQDPLFPLPPFGVGANMAFPTELMRSLGGFDEALGAGTLTRGGEDTRMFTQVLMTGRPVVYWPSAMTRHYHRADLAGLESQLTGYGSGLTAFYASMVLADPRNVLRLARLAPTAVRALFGGDSLRVATIGEDFPRHVLGTNRRAMLAGPALYVRQRLRNRR